MRVSANLGSVMDTFTGWVESRVAALEIRVTRWKGMDWEVRESDISVVPLYFFLCLFESLKNCLFTVSRQFSEKA